MLFRGSELLAPTLGVRCNWALAPEDKKSLPKSRRCFLPRWFDDAVVDPEQQCRQDTHAGNDPPDALRLVRDFAKLMHDAAAEPSADQRADADGQKCKAHVGALLSRRREAGDVFVIAGRLDHFAESENENRKDRADDSGLKGKDQPRERGDERAENDALECGQLAN